MRGVLQMSSIFDNFFNQDRENREPGEIEYTNDKPENESTIKLKASIYGRVQGVGFRFSTKQLADELGINGTVRNENDGSVYVEASGNDEQMEQFIEELAKGPSPSAQVERVSITYDSSITDYNGFGEQR